MAAQSMLRLHKSGAEVRDRVQVLKGFHWRANRFVAIKKINVFEKASTCPGIGQR